MDTVFLKNVHKKTIINIFWKRNKKNQFCGAGAGGAEIIWGNGAEIKFK